MVIGLLVISAIPTTIGVCQALSAQKKANEAAKEKNKFNLTATVLANGQPVECFVVLQGGRLWLDHPDRPVAGHRFAGHYFPYPGEAEQLGLVSTIADDPPVLHWVFAQAGSGLLCHGGRQASLGHTVGPWHWTDDERWLTLRGGHAGFVAGRDGDTADWALAWVAEGAGGETPMLDTCIPVHLHRKMLFGMESQYVKPGEAAKASEGKKSKRQQKKQQQVYDSDGEESADDYVPRRQQQQRGGKGGGGINNNNNSQQQTQQGGGLLGGLGGGGLLGGVGGGEPLGGLGGLGGLDGVQNTAGGLVNGATGALGGLGGLGGLAGGQQGGGGGGKSDTLRLRLDLNLDIEITLKAKIHGDLELALLTM
ncbi:hypothetical protein P8C59_001366 [Phyllachora maydis]|uniref:Uncharacterized protein n=1 Tax=Phyllachora maydis TaxID=1825666 RepID=A0AAD9HZI7_9PEZI|nr:hypothetical protein P8C59_001366 [Phyllachora maydis]